MTHHSLETFVRRTLCLLAVLSCAALAHAKDVTIAIVDDGSQSRELLPTAVLLEEINNLLGDEFQVAVETATEQHGDWSLGGASAALNRRLADADVDLVVTTGLLGSAAAANRPELPKPVIALMVGDIDLQRYPHEGGRSGKRNFTYLYDYSGIGAELRDFSTLARFAHVAMLVDSQWLAAVPALSSSLPALAAEAGTRVTLVAAEAEAAAVLDKIPADADAVYVTPLMRFDWAELERLSDGLIARKLPSFSSVGRAEVELGLLGTTSGSTVDSVVIARRVALLAQRILLGADAATLSVGFESHGRLLLNMNTARRIGFSPTWAALVDAEVLHREQAVAAAPVSLVEAMKIAVEANLDLRIAEFETQLSRDEIKLARAPLLPQLELEANAVQIDDDVAAALGLSVERSTDVALVASQLIYSEDVRAGYGIAKLLAEASDDEFRAATLNTLAAASTSYLALLRAKALEGVTRSNVEVTRTNLDLANVRARTGYSGRAEVLRWESEIARNRQNLAGAEAAREQAETELKRVLSRPQSEALATSDRGLSNVIALLESPGFQKYVDNPMNWSLFQAYYAELALENAPEISAFETLVRAQDRKVKADRRRFYLPEVALQARAIRNLGRSGVLSSEVDELVGDDTWFAGVQLTLPLFNGGALRSELNRSRHRLRQLETERDVVEENIEARVRSALQAIGGSYPSIELSQQAADAAARNLSLVTDQYARGAVSVTDLIDAQEAKLQADLAATDARYVFLIDFVEVQRAAGDFQLLLQPGQAAEWMNELETFFQERRQTGR